MPKSEMIKIDVQNGRYIPMERKHRVCAMKRYDYPNRILARITYSVDIDSDFYFLVDYSPSESALAYYYKCYEKYGLNKDDVLNYLSAANKSLCKIIIEKKALNKLEHE